MLLLKILFFIILSYLLLSTARKIYLARKMKAAEKAFVEEIERVCLEARKRMSQPIVSKTVIKTYKQKLPSLNNKNKSGKKDSNKTKAKKKTAVVKNKKALTKKK